MSDMNRWVGTGNLTRDAELRATASGTAVLSLRLASNESRKTPNSWEEIPNYIDAVLFGPRAEKIASYLTKGTRVEIDGKLRFSSWDDKNTGDKRSKLEVVVDDLHWTTRAGASSSAPQPNYEDDIPF